MAIAAQEQRLGHVPETVKMTLTSLGHNGAMGTPMSVVGYEISTDQD